jgi:hypothetical protein
MTFSRKEGFPNGNRNETDLSIRKITTLEKA